MERKDISFDDLRYLFDAESPQWDMKETLLGLRLQEKIMTSVNEGKIIPQPIYEAMLTYTKTCNSGLALINRQGEIALIPREAEELWVTQLHLPGVTHRREWLREATRRALTEEVIRRLHIGLRYEQLVRVAVLELQDQPRAMCQSNLFVAWIDQVPAGMEQYFFSKARVLVMLQDEGPVIYSHRTVTLPWLIAYDFLEPKWSWRWCRLQFRLWLRKLSGF